MSLSSRVLLGLALGILAGIFFGESITFLEGPGRAFVVLLQMTVLPYVFVALIHSLGRLEVSQARTLGRYAGSFLLLIWGITLTLVAVLPLAFPDWESASFFSSSLVEPVPEFDPVALYLPANPFHALAEGVVPAVVVFAVALGFALMVAERKQALVESLGTLEDTLQRIASFVVSLAPYGVFAIAGNAAGTMRAGELLGLQVYAASYVLVALVLSLWVLPILVTTLTPFGYREVAGQARAAFVTAFATGSVFVVLPLLAGASKRLLEGREETRDAGNLVDVVVPIAFTVSTAGKLLSLSFVLFAGWLSGFELSAAKLPEFLVTGVFSFFAHTTIAIPFMLDTFRIPADTFQLFLVADNVVSNRFGSMLGAIHILSLALLSACGAAGVLRARTLPLLRWAGIGFALVLVGLLGVRVAFESLERPYEGYALFVERELLLPQARVREIPPEEVTHSAPEPTLERIAARGAVRVGWSADSLPFAFRNVDGALVGFDVEMAHALARDLGVDLELVEIGLDGVEEALDLGRVDLVMSGLVITPRRLVTVAFSDPYLEGTLGFVVKDHRRDEFDTRQELKQRTGLRIGVPNVDYYADKIERYLVDAEIVRLGSPRQFFRGRSADLDALVYGAEAGSAWTLIYPEYSVALPQPDLLKIPMGYATRRGDSAMVEFLNRWILLKQRDLTTQRLFAYWVQGLTPHAAREPRWSVLHDVLGWQRNRDEP